MLIYAVLGAFVLVADRVAHASRRRHSISARRRAEYPVTDPTTWRQPSNNER
jgi:hypothetical protein